MKKARVKVVVITEIEIRMARMTMKDVVTLIVHQEAKNQAIGLVQNAATAILHSEPSVRNAVHQRETLKLFREMLKKMARVSQRPKSTFHQNPQTTRLRSSHLLSRLALISTSLIKLKSQLLEMAPLDFRQLTHLLNLACVNSCSAMFKSLATQSRLLFKNMQCQSSVLLVT